MKKIIRKVIVSLLAFTLVLTSTLLTKKTIVAEDGGLDVEIKIKKVLEGRDVKEGEFTFELWNYADMEKVTDVNGKSEVTNDANGEASFTVHVTRAGEFGYYIREKNTGDPDIKYDTEHKHVVFTVSEQTIAGTAGGDLVGVDGYTPKKHDANGELVQYDHGGEDETGWYSAKTVTDSTSTEHVFCGVNYKLSGNNDVNTNAGVHRFKATNTANWEVYMQNMYDWELTKYPTWLDMVAYLYSYDWRNKANATDSSGAHEHDNEPVLLGAPLLTAVKRIFYNGYPYNASGIEDTTGLRKTTQEALFYVLDYGQMYLDGTKNLEAGNFREYASSQDDFDALVKYALKGENTSGYNLQEAPKDMEVYVYFTMQGTASDGTLTWGNNWAFNAQPLLGVYSPNPGQKELVCNDAPVVEFKNEYTGTPVEEKNPTLKTTATNKEDGGKEVEAKADVVVVDTVTYTDLEPNTTYNMSGTLVLKSDESVKATATKEFTTDETGSGTVELEFSVDTSALNDGDELVVFESLLDANKEVVTNKDGNPVEHKDLNDTDQTVKVTKPEEPTPEPKELKGLVVKAWIDNNDKASRPEKVTIVAEVNGEIHTYELTAENEISTADLGMSEEELAQYGDVVWAARLEADDVATYLDENGEPYHVEVNEARADGYRLYSYANYFDKEENLLSIVVENEKLNTAPVKISKQDLAGNEVYGAQMTLINSLDETVIEEWVSDGTTKEFTLYEGQYTLKEVAAPFGFTVISEFNIAVKNDGTFEAYNYTDGEVEVVDGTCIIKDSLLLNENMKPVYVSKVDIAGKELPGAKIQILHSEEDGNNVMEEWTSTEDPHPIALLPGTYKFHEESAPEGYKALTTDIEFEVDENYNIKVLSLNGNTASAEGNKLSVTNFAQESENHTPDNPSNNTPTNNNTPSNNPSRNNVTPPKRVVNTSAK